MGRVDEALRRAAQSRSGTTPDEAPVTGLAVDGNQFPVGPDADEAERDRARERDQAAFVPPTADVLLHSQVTPADPTVAALPRARPGSKAGKLPVNALLEHIDSGLAEKIVIDQNMSNVSREQYRRLAATLHQWQVINGLKVVMIASATAGEGKTLTASNLGLTFSESYHRSVLLIDSDLRRPSLHTVFKVKGSPGLIEGLMSIEERKIAIHEVSPRLTVLPAGMPSADPMAGLTSERMHRVITEARDAFDWVIIDTPPIGLLTDANLLASWVDGVVLVVKADATPYPLVQRAVEAIGRQRILGVVLNRATVTTHGGSGYDYYRYYSSGPTSGTTQAPAVTPPPADSAW